MPDPTSTSGVTITQVTPDKDSKPLEALPPPAEEPAGLDPVTARTLAAIGMYHGELPPDPNDPDYVPPSKKEEPKPEDKKAEDKPADKPEDKKAEDKPADKKVEDPKPEDKPEDKKPEDKQPDDPLATAARELANAARELGRQRETPTSTPTQPQTPEEPREVRETKAALDVLAKQDPRYAGRDLVKEWTDYNQKLTTYQEKWEAAHPDQDFDPEADEHASWFRKNDFDVPEAEIAGAKWYLRGKAESEADLQKIEKQRRAESLAQTAVKAATEDETTLLTKLGVSGKTVDEVEESDPELAIALDAVKPRVAGISRAIVDLFTPGSEATINPGNPDHVLVAQMAQDYEVALRQRPAKDTVYEGRAFAPISEFQKMTPEQQKRHWTIFLEPQKMRELVVADLVTHARTSADRLKTRLSKRKAAAPPPEKKAEDKPADKKAEDPKPAASKPPAGGAGGVADPGGTPGGGPKYDLKSFFGAS